LLLDVSNRSNTLEQLELEQIIRMFRNKQEEVKRIKNGYRISSYSFRGNYSFLNLEIQRSQNIRPKVIVHKGAETIQGRKIIKGGNYMRKYGISKYMF